ncbi:MAG: hypothetical protein HFI43_03920 [Lachnospiraceae bacterium]|jgi:hypothetical protein|nr:hypothetical protein [Lachnospiraceae bacterium]GFI18569.1 hypothetical protein IMSAGC009_03745 [Lachnospiraceae bacterium]
MKKRMILLSALLFLMTGCGQKVITVAGIQSEEEVQADYIEIQEFELKKDGQAGQTEEGSFCAVLIPEGYHESGEVPNMYIHERSPLDSSNIYYSVSEGSGKGRISKGLNKESYRKIMEEAYQSQGQNVRINIDTFEEIDMNGFPGYKIRSTFDIGDGEIEQLAYLILAENTYTITYSQMSDDELMVDFEISDGQIRLVRDESSLARK